MRTTKLTYEVIEGQVVAKANHYMAVPGKGGEKRIIKDGRIRRYEESFTKQCTIYKGRNIAGAFRLFVKVFHRAEKYDLDNSLKTILDCLQYVRAIADDSLCYSIQAEKRIDSVRPRVEFAIEEICPQGNLFEYGS